MKKLGFTLAEALLSLAIIGIVAALTLPSVTLEHRKRTYASSLASAVSDFETAMSTMIMRDGVYDLLDTKAWKYVKDELSGELDKDTTYTEAQDFEEHVKFFSRPIGGGYSAYYGNDQLVYTFNKTALKEDDNSDLSKASPFEMKNGIVYFLYIDTENITKKLEEDMLNNGSHLYANAASVVIDVNGKEKPNTIGRDIFFFILGADGKLFPYGGKDHTIWSDTEIVAINGIEKTAELVNNYYKMNY